MRQLCIFSIVSERKFPFTRRVKDSQARTRTANGRYASHIPSDLLIQPASDPRNEQVPTCCSLVRLRPRGGMVRGCSRLDVEWVSAPTATVCQVLLSAIEMLHENSCYKSRYSNKNQTRQSMLAQERAANSSRALVRIVNGLRHARVSPRFHDSPQVPGCRARHHHDARGTEDILVHALGAFKKLSFYFSPIATNPWNGRGDHNCVIWRTGWCP